MVRVANEYLQCRCKVQQENPKKNMSADRYERYKAARTLQEVLDLGGSRGDIGNDMLRGSRAAFRGSSASSTRVEGEERFPR